LLSAFLGGDMDQSGELKGSPTGLVGVAWCVVK